MKLFIFQILFFCVGYLLLDSCLSLILLKGQERYFGLREPAEIVIIGHSHTVLGINKRILENSLDRTIAVYAREGANTSDRLLMLSQYFERFPESSPLVIYEVNPRIFNRAGLSENSHVLFYPFIDEPVVLKYLQTVTKNPSELWVRKYLHLTRYNDVTVRFSIRGWSKTWDNLKRSKISELEIASITTNHPFSETSNDTGLISSFRNMILLCEKHNSKILLIGIPNIDILRNQEGQCERENRQLFSKLPVKGENLKYIDYDPQFNFRREYFYDPVHLNYQGQLRFTIKLAHDIDSLYYFYDHLHLNQAGQQEFTRILSHEL